MGAPSVFVNKNRLGRFPEFRDQGVGGSNPLSPTNSNKASYAGFLPALNPKPRGQISARTFASLFSWRVSVVCTHSCKFQSLRASPIPVAGELLFRA
jgi:hypothetical protein